MSDTNTTRASVDSHGWNKSRARRRAMFGALVLALWLAGAAPAAAARRSRYDKLPQYGGDYDAPAAALGDDDYRERSPDAPALPDYKYEEEPKGNVDMPSLKDKESDNNDSWQKSVQKERTRDNEDYSDILDKHNQEEAAPKFRTDHRFTKHRSRLKNDLAERDMSRRRFDNDEAGDVDKDDNFRDKDFRDAENDKNMDEGTKYRKTTQRIVRRRPRDKQRPALDEEELDEIIRTGHRGPENEDLDIYRNIIGGEGRPPSPGRLRHGSGRRQLDAERRRARPPLAAPPDVPPNELHRPRRPNVEEYDDYYDMKRLLNRKTKPPKAWVPPQPPSFREADQFLPNRRVFNPPGITRMDTTEETTTTEATQTPTPTNIKLPTKTTAEVTQTTTESTVTTLRFFITTENATASNKSEGLSIAERSRLSILRKLHRKESLKNWPLTKKPPVLLQVTKKVPTLVMVEQATSGHPWMRARDVTADTPERLEQAKVLMRRKLVANARSVHDLTDNWDDLVCDYIDVSLLENVNAAPRRRLLFVIIRCVIVVLWLI